MRRRDVGARYAAARRVAQVLHASPRRCARFVVAEDRHERAPRGRRVLELLAELVGGSGIHVDAQARAPQLGREPQRLVARTSSRFQIVTITSTAPRTSPAGNMLALGHHDEDPLEAEREAARRNIAPEEHADQVVVAPAAAEAAGEIRRRRSP